MFFARMPRSMRHLVRDVALIGLFMLAACGGSTTDDEPSSREDLNDQPNFEATIAALNHQATVAAMESERASDLPGESSALRVEDELVAREREITLRETEVALRATESVLALSRREAEVARRSTEAADVQEQLQATAEDERQEAVTGGAGDIPIDNRLSLRSAETSSDGARPGQSLGRTDAKRLIDDLHNTYNGWFSGGETVGAWFSVKLDMERTITGVRLLLAENRFYDGELGDTCVARIQTALVVLPDGNIRTVSFENQGGWQYRAISPPAVADSLRFVVDSAYKEECRTVGVGQVEVYGR